MGDTTNIEFDPLVVASLQNACREARAGRAPAILVRTEARFDEYISAMKILVLPTGMVVRVEPDVPLSEGPNVVAGQVTLGVWRENGRPQKWVRRRFKDMVFLDEIQ